MKRGLLSAFLAGALVSAAGLALVTAAFARPQWFSRWLFSGPMPAANWWSEGRAVSANAEIVARVNAGVVTVVATRAARPEPERQPEAGVQRGSGTGFIVDPQGYVVTNEHVIKDADRIRVRLSDGRERRATVQGTDRATDLALLKIEALDLSVVDLGDSDAVRVGDPVIAIGNPLDYERSVTAGIVSAKGRKVYNEQPFEDYLQTDAAINRGNSGGPLLNMAGQVIGVNTIIRVDGRGISFAIPSNMVRRVVTQLRAYGYVARGFLGVGPQNLSPEFRDGLGLGDLRGVLISTVVQGSPAARAGLQTYDVITHFDGRQIGSTDEFFNFVAHTSPQQQVEVGYVRNGQPLKVRATLDLREEQRTARQFDPPASGSRAASGLGFAVRDNTPEAQHALRVGVWTGEVTGGVIVSEVDPLSPAGESGLAVGHVILEANRQPIRQMQDFDRLTERLRHGSALVLRLSSPHQRDLRLLAIRVGDDK